ncbi:MAG: hypothetical protein ACD_60C00137G0030 [uncultured bacterium]|nr:MAG: hypothetical protein ACD_60C00137G0030 [uncultured bacterium]
MNIFQETISEEVWDNKYRYRFQEKIMDHTIEDTWLRVAKAVAKAEQTQNAARFQQEFYDVLAGFHFLPGGRILAGAGTKNSVTLFNCFVMPILEDSLTGIFDSLKEAALTLQQGGGVGYDFSTLRPNGYLAAHAGTLASGPVSFMRIWNAMCATLESTGARRGAMMGILRCDHPDIEEFVTAKADPKELRHFNVSVLVSDAFMQAVKENREWELIFPASEENLTDTVLRHWSNSAEPVPCRILKRVKARELWQKIMTSAYEYAEPGVLFEDTINRQNNLWYREWISTTNPCGEIPLPIYGACNLGSINLTQFVIKPYQSNADLDWKKLEKTIITATRFLDNVIDISRYPLKMQKQEVYATRRIGLGVTGLADMLVMLGISYGSDASLKIVNRLMKFLMEKTWQASVELAKERGVFGGFHAQKYAQGNFVQQLSSDLCQDIEKYGIRNSHHNAIAPTGTISLLANNISHGIEPIFSVNYERTVRGFKGVSHTFSVLDYALREWQKTGNKEPLPPAWVDTKDLTPKQHLRMQATIQGYVDQAISKTINLPKDFPFKELSDVYSQAYEAGLKGCTIFRPNPVTGSVLTVNNPDELTNHCC